jgi:hypothetical protein
VVCSCDETEGLLVVVVDLVDDPRWNRLVKAFDAREELGSPEMVGSARWNRAFDAVTRALGEVVSDVQLIADIRELATVTSDPRTLRLIWEATAPPMFEYGEEVESILADLRVGLTADAVRWEWAVYVVEHTRWGRKDPYESDTPDEELNRYLTRIGGAPTSIPGFPHPELPFLMQVDLGEQLRDEIYGEAHEVFLDGCGLPAGGLLQLFHSTTGDSVTDPDARGGGAMVRYFTEQQLLDRHLTDSSEDCVMFPVFDARSAIAPSFAPTSSSTAEQTTAIVELQRAQDRAVRGDEPSDSFALAEMTNPVTAVAESVTRLLGVGHPEHRPLPEHIELLRERLPLASPRDAHVLLFDVSSEFALDNVFGDPGRLEIWIRRSDLNTAQFDDVVSFWHGS